MPNTLAHFGIQGVVTRGLAPNADAKWIFLGCIIPDIPWILLIVIGAVFPSLDPYELRLYAIVQASLAASLLLAGALAMFATKWRLVFGVLAFNSLLHLLLDAVEIKWGNGVHLFAPVSWELLNIGLFWPDSMPAYALTMFGLGYFLHMWRRSLRKPSDRLVRARARAFLGIVLLAAYCVAPLAFLHGPELRDNHSVQTLRDRSARTGRAVQFDRERYFVRSGREVVRTFAGEELVVTGERLGRSGRASIRATFVDVSTISAYDLRGHSTWGRKAVSLLGLALLAGMWIASAWHCSIGRAVQGLRRSPATAARR